MKSENIYKINRTNMGIRPILRMYRPRDTILSNLYFEQAVKIREYLLSIKDRLGWSNYTFEVDWDGNSEFQI